MGDDIGSMEVSTDEIATVFDVTRRSIQSWARAGMPRSGRGKYPLAKCVRWVVQRWQSRATTGADAARKAREKWLRAKAGRESLKLRNERQEVMPVAVVDKAAFEAGRQIRDQVQSIADRCAPLVAAESDQHECRMILRREIDYILQGLADKLKVTP